MSHQSPLGLLELLERVERTEQDWSQLSELFGQVGRAEQETSKQETLDQTVQAGRAE